MDLIELTLKLVMPTKGMNSHFSPPEADMIRNLIRSLKFSLKNFRSLECMCKQ
jgi:hypothetical protein